MNSETKIIGLIGLITIVIIALGLMFAGGSSSATTPVAIQPSLLIHSDSPRIQGSQVKMQIVEFADFECPACAAEAPNIRQLLDENKDKIDYVFRLIPIHQYSKDAAAAAFAAGEQGKFFEMGDILFAKQDEWSADGANRSTLFENYATNLGLDMTKFKSDLVKNRAKYDAIVDRDAKDAETMNINSTPTLIINGNQVIKGALFIDKLRALLEQSSGVPSSATSTASASGANSANTDTQGSSPSPTRMMPINGATTTPQYNPDGSVKVQRY